jgi:hypothetical protein
MAEKGFEIPALCFSRTQRIKPTSAPKFSVEASTLQRPSLDHRFESGRNRAGFAVLSAYGKIRSFERVVD